MAVLLLCGCGLRTQELFCLNIEHVDVARHDLFLSHGKCDRQQLIPEAEFAELLTWLHERGGGPSRGIGVQQTMWSVLLRSSELCLGSDR